MPDDYRRRPSRRDEGPTMRTGSRERAGAHRHEEPMRHEPECSGGILGRVLYNLKDEHSLSRRHFCAGGLFGAAGVAAFIGLLRNQVFDRKRGEEAADFLRYNREKLRAKRGTIFDRNGNILAKTVECSNVYIDPRAIKTRKTSADILKVLVEVLHVDAEQLKESLLADSQFAYVKKKVDEEDCQTIRDRLGDKIYGVSFEPEVKRVYPYGQVASQVLGVCGDNGRGLTGLESYYDKDLTGKDGWVVRERGGQGEYVPGGDYAKEPAVKGKDLVLTIDVNIQRAAEDAMAWAVHDSKAKYGSVIVNDPATGEILAACSNPTYDMSNLAAARTEDMNLRVVTDAYEPGSVFKALVCGMACDMGKVDPDTVFHVPATVIVGSDPVQDVDERSYDMNMTVREIMRRSSNTGMVLVGKKIGADKFDEYLRKHYEFGKNSGVDFPGESLGIIKKRKDYDGSSLGSMSFGQGIAVSPIEMVRAMSGIANGGVMTTPHFLMRRGGKDVDWGDTAKRAISAQAAEQVVSMMETVVAEGTGSAAQIQGYRIAGKTGTAQRAGESGGYEESNNMASFLGFVSPDEPRAMVYVTLDATAGTSAVAMPPFRKVMQATIDALGIDPE